MTWVQLCCGKVPVQILLIVFNLAFLLVGLVMLAFGIFAQVKPEFILGIVGEIPDLSDIPGASDLGEIITASAISMIILGAVVTAVGSFGCFGVCCRNRAILITYIVILVVVLFAEVALIIFAAVAPEKLKGIIQDGMQESLGKFKEDAAFENGMLEMPRNNTVSWGWTLLQYEINCCGIYNYTDYSSWPHNVTINGTTRSADVPISCCARTKCTNPGTSYSYDSLNFCNLNECLDGNSAYINQKNCYDAVFDIIIQSRAKSIGIVAGIIGEQLLLIILAAILCNQYRKEKDSDEDIGIDVAEVLQDLICSCME